MQRGTRTVGAALLGALFLVLGSRAAGGAEAPAAAPAASPERVCRVASYKLNDFKPQLDGQWQGIAVASDGNVYFASSTHSAHHGAAFFKYDPRTRKVTLLCKDITTVCGEDPEKTPQPKIHSAIVEAHGWLYFATHFSGGGPGAAERYPGAHIVGYELAAGKFRDLGVVRKNFTIYSGIGVDPKRKCLYAFCTPITAAGAANGEGSHMYRIAIASGAKQDLGMVRPGTWGHCFWLFVDRRGDVWFTVGDTNGALMRIRGASGKIERFDNALPPLLSWSKDQVDPDARRQAARWWRWAQPLPDGDRCVFAMAGGGALWTFDSTRDVASGAAFTKVAHIGPADLGMALGGGRVYYVQRANRKRGHKASDHHLLSVSLDPKATPAILDHGLIVDQEGRRPWRLPSLAADERGHVYMVGDWRLKPGEKGTLRYGYDRRNARDTWRWLWRGQFFAAADVSADLEAAGK